MYFTRWKAAKVGVWCLLFPILGNAASFHAPFNSERDLGARALPAAEAAAAIALPPGFKAQVFAAEPDVNNPIAAAWDGKGRLWVAENYTYAEYTIKFEPNLRDRILVFEDRGEGSHHSRKVFLEGLHRLTGLEVGHGGIWATCPPQLLFIPDRDGDAVPDGPPEVVLDGFDVPTESHHTVVNGVKFGPDGWLYGRCGSSSPGEVGPPGTPNTMRIPVRGSLWRYHPRRKVFETLSGGTTNPWGHDWDKHGELFFINTVNGHLWHAIPGAHFQRTPYPNHEVYALLDHHADHWHFDTGEGWKASRDGAANLLGGGHAHVGMMIYRGDHFPPEYRDRLFTLNFHGRRMNQELLERSGSGYVGKHGPDFFISGDKWFRGQEITYGPDGGVFVLDWSDTGECHESTGVHRTSGRIFKVTYGRPEPSRIGDLARLDDAALVKLHRHRNEWFVRQSRLELSARAAGKRDVRGAVEGLRALLATERDVALRLNALWTLHAMDALTPQMLRGLLRDENEHVRTWGIRLLSDAWPIDTVMSRRPPRGDSEPDQEIVAEFVQIARTDSSGLVRLALASALQRLPLRLRADLAMALGSRAEDANDHNLPLMLWYGLIPVAESDPSALVEIAASCELPTTRRLVARRLAEGSERHSAAIEAFLKRVIFKSAGFQADVMAGLAEGFKGWRKARKPDAWDALTEKMSAIADGDTRDRIRDLSVLFGSGRAIDEVRRVALDARADIPSRQAALQALIASGAPDLRQVCEQLLSVRGLNSTALLGLAQFDERVVGEKIAKSYRNFFPGERDAVIGALVSRPRFVHALLGEIAAGRIPRSALTPFHARQIRGYGDAEINKRLREIWGDAREPASDKRGLIERLKAEATPTRIEKANLGNGRAIYERLCSACHTLYGEGGRIGPDLTGSGRANLDYLLENIVDPNAIITADFRLNVITLRDGRTLSGFVAGRSPRTLTINTLTEPLTVELSEVASQKEMPQSLMPEGLLESVESQEAIDLLAYLMHPTQVAPSKP